jgi:predicted glycoside hydrolase/deacetylase ChbG (UPF0249 family)
MQQKRYLIVNADDFGMSLGINRGIIQAHEQGIVTSASLMVRWPAAEAAAAYARQRPQLSVGLHLDLGEWAYTDDQWTPLYQVVPPDDLQAVHAEAWRQLAEFRRLLGRDPTHLDSHQHVHLSEPAKSILIEMARQLNLPLRHLSGPAIRYCGDFYGQGNKGEPFPDAISVPSLLRILRTLAPGLTELACHAGYDDGLVTMYRRERRQEVLTLCNPQVRSALGSLHIELSTFAQMDLA